MKVAVIGAAGQLGSELVATLGPRAVPLAHGDIDIVDSGSVERALTNAAVTAVINCAAYNLVDKAEEEPEVAYRVNALGPRNLAQTCGRLEIPLLQVSTDYVFGLLDQGASPQTERDVPCPANAYAVSKLAGEHFVLAASKRNLVVRTCGLYGRRSQGTKGNFVDTIARLARERDELQVVNDQRCTPTNVADLAPALVALVDAGAAGLFHATNAGECTWHELASAIVAELGLSTVVRPVSSDQFPRPARRPSYSVLNCDKLAGVIGGPLSPWREALSRHLGTQP